MTLWPEEGHVVLMLDQDLQAQLIEQDPDAFRPHPSKWGAKGATIAVLRSLTRTKLTEAIEMAYRYALR